MPRYKEVKRDLANMIEGMQNGERIPSRVELCRRLDTTQATLGKAVRELTEEGVLSSKSKSGTYVARRFEGAKREMENWAVVFPFLYGVYNQLIDGIREVADERNANLILCESKDNASKQENYIKRMIKADIDGFVIAPIHSSSVSINIGLYAALIQSEVPFVFCNRSVDGVCAPVVRSNDFYGGYIATRHMINRGYKNIAFVSRMMEYRTSLDRCQGYMSALQEHGVSINRRRIVFYDGPVTYTNLEWPMALNKDLDDVCYEKTRELILRDPELDGIVCFNDATADSVLSAISDAGRAVSDEIGVIGYDGSERSLSARAITSVDYGSREMGGLAANVLAKLISGEKISGFNHYLICPRIVERESCLGPVTQTVFEPDGARD